jgi:monovalent cation:H+ antiporter-2, CPA2 family
MVLSGVLDGPMLLAAGDSAVSPVFGLLAILLILAVLGSLLMLKFRQSVLVGYMLVGIIVANSGALELIHSSKNDPAIASLGELGVILLMFTLGLEFSLTELKHLWRIALLGGGLQVLVTSGLSFAAAHFLGFQTPEAIVLSIAVALSSTAVAMKSFQEIGLPNSPGARTALGVGLFQDILVIMFFLILPALYGKGDGHAFMQITWALTKGVLFLGAAVLWGRFGNTPLFHVVARTRSRELFTLTIIGMCAAVALAGEALDLSLALGAFAAGIVLSESIYSHRIMADIMPFKDLFLTIFFVSVGLMIDLTTIMPVWHYVLGGCVLLISLKGLVVLAVCRVLKMPLRPALLAAASLASTGEFSLVLLQKAGTFRPFDPATFQLLLACTAVTMGLVPSLMKAGSPLSKFLEKKGVAAGAQRPGPALAPGQAVKKIADHGVICGYGPVGRSLNEAMKRCDVPTLVMELNSDTVRQLKSEGQPVLFADAAHPEALDLAGIERARFVAFTFPNIAITLASLPLVREKNPGIVIFGRAKFQAEAEQLEALGVEVIHDEKESAKAMIESAMSVYQRADLSDEDVEEIVES